MCQYFIFFQHLTLMCSYLFTRLHSSRHSKYKGCLLCLIFNSHLLAITNADSIKISK